MDGKTLRRRILAGGLIALLSVPLGASVPELAEGGTPIATRIDSTDRMVVGVRIADKGPFQFIVDTGAERTVISSELADELDLQSAGPVGLHSLSESATVDTVIIPRLSLEGRTVENIRAPALQAAHLGAAGILGIDSLHDQRVVIDFRKRRMTVHPSTRRPEPISDGEEIVVRARNRLGRLILADASVGGRKISMIVDTGAEASLGNSALLARVTRGGAGAQLLEMMGVTGGSVTARSVVLRGVQINQLKFSDMPVAIADAHVFRQLGLDKRPALLLGMDVLRIFDFVSVDFANREVRFVMPGVAGRDEATRLALSR